MEKLKEERKLAIAEKDQRRREMLMRRKRSNQGGEYIGPLDDSDEMSQKQSPDDGFQTVGETNKRRRKGFKKKKKREAKNERDREEDTPPTSPRSAPSSPYHPDIGESNGTLLGTDESEKVQQSMKMWKRMIDHRLGPKPLQVHILNQDRE